MRFPRKECRALFGRAAAVAIEVVLRTFAILAALEEPSIWCQAQRNGSTAGFEQRLQRLGVGQPRYDRFVLHEIR